jgi:hypothetical protein
MKKILLSALVALVAGFYTPVDAQCNFSGAGVKLNGSTYTDPVTGQCMINIDLYFDLQSNAGGKYVYVHIWPTSLYPDYSYSNPPLAADLVNSVATLGFYHFGSELYLLETYTPDLTIANFKYTGMTITKGPGELSGYDRFAISNLIIASPVSCTVPQSFTADAWESQSSSAQNIHCYSKGLAFYANDPKITGLLFCQVPRTYRFEITTINTAGISISYKVFLNNGDGVYNKTTDTIQLSAASDIALNNSNEYKFTSPVMSYEPYSSASPYADRSLWIVVTSPSITNEVYARLDNSCIPLPVQFRSFTAARNKTVVTLKWTTASEADNKGFYIERRNAGGEWATAGFIASSAMNGNSQQELDYSFADINTYNTITEYRIKQMDINDKASYSVTRPVKGYGQSGDLIIYPNPSPDGRLNIVFEKLNYPFTLELFDMNGRLIRKWVNYNETRLTMINLQPGIYMIKLWLPETKEQISGKVIVNRQ